MRKSKNLFTKIHYLNKYSSKYRLKYKMCEGIMKEDTINEKYEMLKALNTISKNIICNYPKIM